MTRYVNYRERGQSTLTTLLGMALGAFVIGGLMLFYFTASDNSHKSTSRADQEADAVKVLNRAGRDIADSAEVRTSREDVVVVEQRSVNPTTKKQESKYVGYAVIDDNGDGLGELMRYEGTSATFDPDQATVLARNVVVEDSDENDDDNDRKVTKFEYKNASGQVVGESASDVGLVDITYVAKTKSGLVEISTSASVNTGVGGSVTPTGSSPTAQDVVITVRYRSNGSATASFDAVDGTPAFSYSGGTLPVGVSVTVNPTTGAITANVSSLFTGSVPSGDIAAGSYTVTGTNGSASGGITVRIVPADAVAVAPAHVEQCGPVNDSFTIPAVDGVRYTRNGSPVAAGTHAMGGSSVTIQATADSGYALTNPGASWTLTDANTTCAASVMAYPESAPSSNTVFGVNVITWSGGPVQATRVSGSDLVAPTLLSGNALTESAGTARVQVMLGTVYRYTVNGTSDLATQFPLNQLGYAQGSDRDGDADRTPDALGFNTVRASALAPLADNGIQEIWSYKSQMSYENVPEVDPSSLRVATVPVGLGSTNDCASNTPGNTGCWLDTGRARGSETIYVPVSYVPADDDYAANPALTGQVVMKNGMAYFPAFNRTQAADTRATYDYAYGRAYQAPNVAATNVAGGNPAASDCFTSDSTPARLVYAGPTGSDNSLYSCDTLRGDITYSAYADTAARTASFGVAPNAASGPFCDYADNPGSCLTRVVGGYSGVAWVSPSNTNNPTQATTVRATRWAASDLYTITPCNLGGCHTSPVQQRMNSHAGKFAYSAVIQRRIDRYKRYRLWYHPVMWTNAGGADPSNVTQPRFAVRWNTSGGMADAGGVYTYTGDAARGLDNNNASWTNVSNALDSVTPSLNVDAHTVYRFQTRANPTFAAATGKAGQMYRESTSPANLRWTEIYSSPLPVSFLQETGFCRESVDDGFRYGYAFINRVSDQDGTTREASHNIRYMWWIGYHDATRAADRDNIGIHAAYRWRNGSNNPDTWRGPNNWDVTSGNTAARRGTEYYGNSGAIPAAGDVTTGIPGSNTNRVPTTTSNGSGGVAHIMIETYVLRSDVNYPDFGDITYWDAGEYGSYATDGGTAGNLGTSGQSIAGVGQETRARFVDAPTAKIRDCPDGGANTAWTSGNPWRATSSGWSITRRANPGLPAGWLVSPANNGWHTPLP